MAYFRILTSQLAALNAEFCRDDDWLILINADPDAMASALALQRLMRFKVRSSAIARINEITRPDNLAMIRLLRIPMIPWHPDLKQKYTRFAIVDSQPAHNPAFSDIDFSIIIDHHPISSPKSTDVQPPKSDAANAVQTLQNTENNALDTPPANSALQNSQTPHPTQNTAPAAAQADLPAVQTATAHAQHSELLCNSENSTNAAADLKTTATAASCSAEKDSNAAPQTLRVTSIRPEYGACSTMLTELLYNAKIRPGRHLATALQYGIRTDTGTFGRHSAEVDLRAYHYLSRFADSSLLLRILHSEYLPEWLPYFTRAFSTLQRCGSGQFTFLGKVESPDILVVIGDFFQRVHGLRSICVGGLYNNKVILIFRSSSVDMGLLASRAFGDIGSAGGHRSMARAEIPLENLKAEMPDVAFSAAQRGKNFKILEQCLCLRLRRPARRSAAKQADTAQNTAE